MSRTRWDRLAVTVCTLLAAAGSSSAATVSLRAVQVNDTPIAPTDEVTINPGDLVVAEAFISGWDEDAPGNRLMTYQLTIDGLNSYWSGEAGTLLPAGFDWPGGIVLCDSHTDCSAETALCPQFLDEPEEKGLCVRPCEDDVDCLDPYPICIPQKLCVGTAYNPEAFAYTDESHEDFVFEGTVPICAVSPWPLSMSAGCTILSGTPPLDNGGERYALTYTFEASADACGAFSIDFDFEQAHLNKTFIIVVPSNYVFPIAPGSGLTVNVNCPPPVGACCINGGACEDLTLQECNQHSGAWQEAFGCDDPDLSCPKFILGRKPLRAD